VKRTATILNYLILVLINLIKKRKKRLRLGLALGGGSALGFAHIGVLKVLHKNKIYPDYIAGTSAGAIIGAFYSAGYSPQNIEKIVNTTNWKKIMDFNLSDKGLISGKKIEKRIREIMRNKKFKNLKIPLSVVSYNIDKKEKVIFCKGDVAKAVRASISIPGIFSPAPPNPTEPHHKASVVSCFPVHCLRLLSFEFSEIN